MEVVYRKTKSSDTQKFAVITLKFGHGCFTIKDADGMAKSRRWSAVWSGSALFAQTCLSENLGSLR